MAGVNRIIVVPSGPMLGIPLEALPTSSGQYVVDKWEVAYTPSATIWAWLGEKPKRAGSPSLFAVGDPTFDGGEGRAVADVKRTGEPRLSGEQSDHPGSSDYRSVLGGLAPLGGTRKEVADISKLFETSAVLVGEDASETNLVARAKRDGYADYRFIHFATHAIVDDKKAERSFLVLSQIDLPDPLDAVIAGERVIDGRLTMEEVLREWHLDADLVTLSACETGLGRKFRGEGYVGFAHAFFQAGTRSALVSLWRVDDRATRRLMVRFYENMLGRGMTRSASLRDAKMWLRDLEGRGGVKPFSHPAYWSGFILMGDPG